MDIDRIGHETWIQRAADEAMRAEYRRMDELREQHVSAHVEAQADGEEV